MHHVFYSKNYSPISLFSGIVLLLATFCISCKKENKTEPPVFGTCQAVAAKGHLTKGATAGTYTYRTSGGGTITINQTQIIIAHDNYPGFKLEYWGDAGTPGQPLNSANHENLNGKHIKSRIDSRRSIIFPDGAKITFIANGWAGTPVSIRIYEGNESHHINPACVNTLEYSSTNGALTKQLDDEEADGETGTFEFTATGLLYVNIYTENTPGSKLMNRVLLGELFKINPSQVTDYYDDPRHGHT
jgi:hypothetical protein